MKSLLAAFAVLGALTTAALADEAQSDSVAGDAANACSPAQDCSTLEGDAKTECEAKAKAAEDGKSAESTESSGAKKGGKSMNETNDGNMESYDKDE